MEWRKSGLANRIEVEYGREDGMAASRRTWECSELS